jgi:O-antigen ligase
MKLDMKKIDINVIANYLILLYAFLLPLHKGLVSVIGKILIVLFFFRKDIKDFLIKLWNLKWFKIFLALVIYSIFISFYSSSFSYGLNYTLKKYLPYFEIFVIAFLVEKKFIKYAISAFLLGIFVSEIVSYGIFFNLWETAYNLKAYNSEGDPTPFMHHTYYSLFLSIGILIILVTLLEEKKNIFLFFFLVTMSINLFIIGGRGGQLAFFITLFILVLYSKNKKFLLLIPFGIFVFIMAYYFSDLFHLRVDKAIDDIKKVIYDFNFCSSWGIRASAWILTFEMLKHNWLFGLGYNNYVEPMKHLIETKFSNFACSIAPLSTHLHNQYLTMLIDGGIFYLVLFLYAFYLFIRLPIKDEYLKKIKLIIFVNFAVLSFVEPVFFQAWSMYLFIFFAAILLKESLSINYK